MAFQGFAREEQFSTHQINIDIAGIIDGDLREASRQSKFMARNQELEEKWRQMYLNAMVNKHDTEKRNREANFKFFMENRRKINEQVKYNNEIKYKDAGQNRHVRDLVGEALLGFAINVGSAGLQKYLSDQKAQSQAAEKEAKEAELAGAKAVNSSFAQSPEHRAAGERLARMWLDGKHKEVDAELASPDSIFYGDNFVSAENLGHWSKLTQTERQRIQYSTQNVSREGQAWAEGQEIDISGAPFTLATIHGANEATQNTFYAELRELFHREFLPTDLNPISQNDAAVAWNKLQDVWQATSRKQQVTNAKLAEHTRINTLAQTYLAEGGVDGLYNYMVTGLDESGNKIPGSPVWTRNRSESISMLGDMIENGLIGADTARDLMGKTFSATDPRSLNEQLDSETPSATAVRFKELTDKLTLQEQRDQQIEQVKIDNMGVDLENKLTSPDMDQQTARGIYYSLLNGKMRDARMMMTKTKGQKLLTAAANAAGITEAPQVVSIGQEYTEKLFPKPEQNTWVSTLFKNAEDGKGIDLSTYTGRNVKMVQEQGANLFKDWVAGLIDSNGWDPRDPRVKGTILNKLSTPGDVDVDRLTDKLQVQTKNPETGILFPDGPRLKGFTMKTVPSNGVKEYNDQLRNNPSVPIGLNEINLMPLSKSWAANINTALGDDNISQQNTLSRKDPLVSRILEKNPYVTPGQIYNAFVKQAKEQGMDQYQPLQESQFLNQGEMRQLIEIYGDNFKRASQPVKAIIAGGGGRMNAATAHIIGKSGGTPGTPGAGNTTGAHLHLETGDGYTGAGRPIPDYVLDEVYAGDKPLRDYIVTSGIGPRESPGGVGSTNHKGIDIAIPHGTPLTIKPGSNLEVIERDDKTRSGYGYVTIVRNKVTNEPFNFAHLSDVGKQAQLPPLTVPTTGLPDGIRLANNIWSYQDWLEAAKGGTN